MTTHITKTWFDGEKIVTQDIPEADFYRPSMTKDEALKLAQIALENLEHSNFKRRRLDALIAIKQALAQPAQETVAGKGKEYSEQLKLCARNVAFVSAGWVNMSSAAMQEMFALIDHVCAGIDSPPLPVQEPVAEAYELADKVRTELDKQSCPGVFMNIAWEAIVKNCRDLIYSTPPLPVQPQQTHETLERELEQALQQRQNRDAVLTDIANLIGVEFSSAYKFADLVRDLDERIANPPLPVQPEQERYFCQRCGKPVNLTTIHTCTPPRENT
jgi:hypothetical protein